MYGITVADAADANYDIVFVGADFTITKATLTVTANAASKVFGEVDPALTYSITGFENGDVEADLDTPVAISRANGEDVGVYAITVADAVDANYDINFVGADFTITKATLTVTANAASKVFGETDPTLTYSITGFENGDVEADLDTPVAVSYTHLTLPTILRV